MFKPQIIINHRPVIFTSDFNIFLPSNFSFRAKCVGRENVVLITNTTPFCNSRHTNSGIFIIVRILRVARWTNILSITINVSPPTSLLFLQLLKYRQWLSLFALLIFCCIAQCYFSIYVFECSAIEFPSVSIKKAMKPFSPIDVLGIIILPPAFSILSKTSCRSGFAFR